jgi:hypothetical protein
MSPEKFSTLRERYPKIFVPSEYQSEPIDAVGIECGNGWFDVIDSLCSSLQKYVDRRLTAGVATEDLQPRAVQVKEKFGGLRFYVSGGDEVVDEMIALVESHSTKVCETCGARGRQHTTAGWIRTSCDPCLENHTRRRSAEGDGHG